jgi:hypothetical protein
LRDLPRAAYTERGVSARDALSATARRTMAARRDVPLSARALILFRELMIGVVFLVLIAGANRKLLRLLTTGTMATARCTSQQDNGATLRLDVTYATPQGPVTTTRTLMRSEGRRVLADPNPVLVVAASDPNDLFILSAIPGLRPADEGDGVAPAPWRWLVWRSLPIAVLAAAGVYALVASRMLPP